MVTVPTLTAVTSPPLVMVATVGSEENHKMWFVIATAFVFFPELGVNARNAVSCTVLPAATEPLRVQR